jgi:DNA-binding response OmpR family regulator
MAAILVVDGVESYRLRMGLPLRENFSVTDVANQQDAEESIKHDLLDLVMLRADTPARQLMLRSLVRLMVTVGRRVPLVAYFGRPFCPAEHRTAVRHGADLVCEHPLGDFALFLDQIDRLLHATEYGAVGVVRVGPLEIDVAGGVVRIHAIAEDVKKGEREILAALAVRRDTTVRYEWLVRATGSTPRGVRAAVDRMCGRFSVIDDAIHTVWGQGYRLESPRPHLVRARANVVELHAGGWPHALGEAEADRRSQTDRDSRSRESELVGGLPTSPLRYDWSPTKEGAMVFDRCEGEVTWVSEREGSRVLHPAKCGVEDRISETVIKLTPDRDR